MPGPETELTLATREVIAILDELEIPYCLGGSLASSLQGIGRATIDGDLVAELMLRHCRPLADRLAPRFVAPIEAIIPALQNESSFNAIHREYFVKVDLFVAKSRPWYRSQMARRQLMPFGDEARPPVWVSAPEDTILAKLDWYRLGGGVSDRQWGDVLGVMKVQAQNLDLAYLRRWAAELRLGDLLDRALDDSGLA
jgi:hypothetical protein